MSGDDSTGVARSTTSTLSENELFAVRRIVLEHVVPSGADWTLDRIAQWAHTSGGMLQARFGRTERLVDEVVAGVLRRARPIVHLDAGDPGVEQIIEDLVHRRLLVDEQIDSVWSHIGQAEASAQEFDVLRATLLTDVEYRLARRLGHLAPGKRFEAILLIDGALSLAGIRSMHTVDHTTFDQAFARLVSQLENLFAAFDIT